MKEAEEEPLLRDTVITHHNAHSVIKLFPGQLTLRAEVGNAEPGSARALVVADEGGRWPLGGMSSLFSGPHRVGLGRPVALATDPPANTGICPVSTPTPSTST